LAGQRGRESGKGKRGEGRERRKIERRNWRSWRCVQTKLNPGCTTAYHRAPLLHQIVVWCPQDNTVVEAGHQREIMKTNGTYNAAVARVCKLILTSI